MQNRIGLFPNIHLRAHCCGQVLKLREVLIVGRQLSRQFPDPLDRIQVRAVGWQEVETDPGLARVKKGPEQSSVVIARVVDDQDHPTASRPMRQKLSQKLSEGHRAEGGFLHRDQLSVAEAHGTEERYRLSGGSMEQHRVRILGRNPHHRPRSVLLEVAFVQAPQINAGVAGQAAEFFYIEPAPPDRLGQ